MKLLLCSSMLMLLLNASAGVSGAPASVVYWRFEGGKGGDAVSRALDETGNIEALVHGAAPVVSGEVPSAIIPSTAAANHESLVFKGGYLRAHSRALDQTNCFTVELWARFGPVAGAGQVLISQGDYARGNWHLIYQNDGTVQAAIYGKAVSYFFDSETGPPVPGVWYHLAATYENSDDGVRIRAFVNGQFRGMADAAGVRLDTRGADFFIGAHVDGSAPYLGQMDELRLTSALLAPRELLTGGVQPIPGTETSRKPVFVKAGTKITAKLRKKAAGAPILARPDGYQYFYTLAAASQSLRCAAPAELARSLGTALEGCNVANGGCEAGYHFAVKPGGQYVVVIAFFDPRTNDPGRCWQRVVIDGREIDPAVCPPAKAPLICKYAVQDWNHDGFLDVVCCHNIDESNYTGMINAIWIFSGANPNEIDEAALLAGDGDIPPLYQVQCGREERLKGHVSYPPLSAEKAAAMLPVRRVPASVAPEIPQPPDPQYIEIRGELSDRIHTYMDRWGYAGRDQKWVAGFLSDSGYEVSGRYLETFSQLGRLMRRDFDLRVPFEALLTRQDKSSKFPGSFVGGKPLRTAFIWGQGTVFSGLMAYHDFSGDTRALPAAGKLADWYRDYLTNGDLAAANYFAAEGKFSRDGAIVGQLGKGALEGIVWLYLRTGNPQYLQEAADIAALNRRWGGVAWMIHGNIPDEKPEYEGWHIHANLTTVRGFPWLYAVTGDRSYLEDAIKACDRVFERATWSTGGVLEQIPWGHDVDPHDETCQTSDLLQLCYLLAEFTGEPRFFDRAERIYNNHLRYMQMHNGDFSAFNRLPGPQRGGDAWYCCGFWGGKALFEVARHIFASSSNAVYINDYLPASATFKLATGWVGVEMDANIPTTGDVQLTLHPQATRQFPLYLRVPAWARLCRVELNGKTLSATTSNNYVGLERAWKPGDKIRLSFDLPLRVELDSSPDGSPQGDVSINGAGPVKARLISIFRGPMILAQFRIAAGCDLNWAYTGDHPDLFDTTGSCVDQIQTRDWRFETHSAPALLRVDTIGESVRLQWQWKPHPGWTFNRTALVKAQVPVEIQFTSGLIAPSVEAAGTVKSLRTCGVRMRTRGFVDYQRASLLQDGKLLPFDTGSELQLPHGNATLDNGYVQFHFRSTDAPLTAANEGVVAALYATPRQSGNSFTATCSLSITGQNQWRAPMIGGGP